MLTHHGTWILETTASWTSSIGRSENHSTMFSVTFGWKKYWWRRGSGSEEAKPTRFRFLWRWFQDTEDTLRMEIREVGGGGGLKTSQDTCMQVVKRARFCNGSFTRRTEASTRLPIPDYEHTKLPSDVQMLVDARGQRVSIFLTACLWHSTTPSVFAPSFHIKIQ